MSQPDTLVERFGPFTLSVSTRELVRDAALRALAGERPVTMPAAQIIAPPIGEYWPAQGGINCGRFFNEQDQIYFLIVSRRAEGQIGSAAWEESMKRAAALRIGEFADWSLGDRPESLGMHERLQARLKGTDDAFPEEAHWTSKREGSGYAWFQYFYGGGQYFGTQYDELVARAVRRVVLSNSPIQ